MSGISITETDVLQVLGDFLSAILNFDATQIVVGQDNRVSEPAAFGGNFVVMTPMMRDRLATNVDADVDTVFTGSIDGSYMTVESVRFGSIVLGNSLFGVDVALFTIVSFQQSGPSGGPGVYTVSVPQTLSSRTLSTGAHQMLQAVKVGVQMDVHGPNSADNSTIISTALRDSYASDFFATSGFDIAPLYAGEPRQAPFVDAEAQYEDRWTFDAVMQVNPVISTPQQFADTVAVQLVEIDAVYPP